MQFLSECAIWFAVSVVIMSFAEHYIHRNMMHRRHFLSKIITPLNKTFENHAIKHHGIYAKYFSDEAVPKGKDRHIRLRAKEGMIEALPFAILMSLIQLKGGIIFELVVCLHHFLWNQIHLEMHKPEQRFFAEWPPFKWAAIHHFLHHRYPEKNFNVVCPIADFLMGRFVLPTEQDLYIFNHQRLAPVQQELPPSQSTDQLVAAGDQRHVGRSSVKVK